VVLRGVHRVRPAALALDLGVFHRHAHTVSFRESVTWSAVWVATALAFNYGFYLYAAGTSVPTSPGSRVRVPDRLHRREVARDRQHLRLRAGIRVLRHPGDVPAPRAVLRDHRGADLPAVFMHGQGFLVRLKYGLAFILIFVGLKMVWLNDHFGGKFPISLSLTIIGVLLAGSIVASLAWSLDRDRVADTPKDGAAA
jgi:hypothetical protein